MEIFFSSHERPESPDFRADILDAISAYELDIAPTERDLALMVDNLTDVWQRYGNPSSPEYLAYHNHVHSFDVADRALQIGALHHEIAPDRVDTRTIVLAMIAGSGHDYYQRAATSDMTDEALSAQAIADRMRERGYPGEEVERVYQAIVATTADHADGHVQQTHVRTGDRDPLKLILAMADIQSMTMEGSRRMLIDVPKLYFEITPPTSEAPHRHIIGLTKFLLSQYSFISDRIDSIPDDLLYYYNEETAEAITAKHREVFRSHGLSAIHTAKHIREHAEQIQNELADHINDIPRTPKQASDLACTALRSIFDSLAHK